METVTNNDNNLLNELYIYENEIKNDYNIFKGNLLDSETKNLLCNDMNAFLIGLISDQSVKVETAWSLPYKLKQRIGYFDISKLIKEYDVDTLAMVLKEKPALHRYPTNIARYIMSACKMIIEMYDGNAENIWLNQSTEMIIDRLEKFKGISHKKAALGCLLLVRDLGLELIDKDKINIVYDIHIRRIFLRYGLVEQDTIGEVFEAARKIYPSFPGYLTSMFWPLGRDICRPQNPSCDICPINKRCAKKTDLGVKINA